MVIVTPSGQSYALRQGNNVIGRDPGCDLRLDVERVSRRHAVIAWDGRRALIHDLNSTNGTFVNGRRLEPNRPVEFGVGDRLELGGPEGRLDTGAVSGPASALPADLGLPESPVEPAPPRMPTWLPVGVGGLVVLLGLALFLLLRPPPAAQLTPVAPPAVTPTSTAPAVVIPPATTPGVATPTLVAVLTVPPAPGAGAGAGAGAPGVQPPTGLQPPAGLPAGMNQAPPINPTTMPELVKGILQEFMPGGLPLTPALPGGTPLPGVIGTLLPPGGLPGLPGGGVAPPAAKRHGPVILKAPANGASYQGEGANLVLEWQPVNDLAANEYYRVMIFYPVNGREQAGGAWLKGTTYRPPAWFLTQHNGRFEWQVVIIEATGPVERNGRPGDTVSEPSERRWFNWSLEPGSAQPTDTPTPVFQG
jgi:hypothetical protein